jgi:dihydropyrimidinase
MREHVEKSASVTSRVSHAIWCVLPLAYVVVATAAQQPATLVIRNGLVVTAEGSRQSDVAIRNGVIADIAPKLPSGTSDNEIDATGLLVLPGGVDPHVHLGGTGDDYTSGSAAALAGGVTTISNFVAPAPDEDLPAALARAAGQIKAQAIADVMLHWRMNDAAADATGAMSALVAHGQPSVKVFMVRSGFDQQSTAFLGALAAAGRVGVLTMLHCEDAAIFAMTTERMIAEGRGSLEHYADSRPVVAEAVATARAVAMSEATGAPVYIVHLSSERALRAAESGRARGLPVFVETRPIYLHFTRERYLGADRGLYVGQPPLREKTDQDALWRALAEGTIHVLGTDHLAYTKAQKLDPTQTVANHRAGMSNLQEVRPLLYSEGVRKGRLSVEQFVAVTSTNAARLFGLYPRKGTVAVGSDADIVLWDPRATRTIHDSDVLSRSGFSLYAGWTVTGWPRVTIRRGEVVYEKGVVLGRAGSGTLLQRSPWRP